LTATQGPTLIEGTVNEISNVTVNGQAAPLAFSAAAPYGFQKELNLPPGDQVITIQSTDGSANSAQKSYTLTVRGDYALAYDVNGNLLTKTWRQAGSPGVDWVKETYTWDKENRLTGWAKERLLVTGVQTAAVLASATWTYDGLGRRVKEQNVAGAAVTNTHFVWDGMAMVQWQNTAGVAQRNLFDEGEQDVATGEKLIYVKDHLGSVRGWHRLSDGARGEADYSAWGVRTVVSNTTGTLPVRSFTGHYQHAASGLVLAPYRGYDAELGRWLSEDPIGEEGGVNLYGYVGNGVVMWVDPLGLETFIIDRPLNPTGKTELPSKPTRSWIAHRFVCVTQPDGSLITVSWGNKYDQDGNGLWSFNAPEDVSAAKHALANGNQGMSYGSKIDPFVPIALGKILMNGSSSHPWEMQNNCQHEAYQLVRSANELMMKTYYPEFFQPK